MSFERELDYAKKIALNAGNILMSYRKKTLEVILKEDNTPQSIADRESSKYICEALKKGFPDYGICDEETYRERDKKRFWLVDPLDGTISYIKGDNSFGVMIALVEDGSPVVGVAYRPATNELCYASKNNGAFIIKDSFRKRMHTNGDKEISLLVSGYRKNEDVDEIIQKISPKNVTGMYSSFKIIEVAKGDYNTFVTPPSIGLNLWDICAGDLILSEAGGILTDLNGKRIDYTGKIELEKGLIAASQKVYGTILEKLGHTKRLN